MLNLFVLSPWLLFLWALLVLVLLYGSICGLLYLRQRHIIFFPTSTLEATPDDYGLAYEEVWISMDLRRDENASSQGKRPSSSTCNGVSKTGASKTAASKTAASKTGDKVTRPHDGRHDGVHGWWIAASTDTAPVLLFLHGNGENISSNLPKAAWFHQLGFAVLLIDYRGYGASRGAFPSESQVYEDAEAAWNYLIQTLQVSPNRLFVFGHSLGGAIAIELATRHPDIVGLIIEGTFTCMLDMSDRTKNFGIFPIHRILNQRFDSIQKVRSLTMPILYVHGTDDDVVPSDMSQTLYHATPTSWDLLLVPGAGHEDVIDVGAADYRQSLQRFVQQTYTATVA